MRAAVAARQVGRRGARGLRRTWRAAARRMRGRWRRSLQVRVVTTTLLVSACVVAVLGYFLMEQIASSLLRGKENSALTYAYNGLSYADAQLGGLSSDPVTRSQQLGEIGENLVKRSGPTKLYEVVILATPDELQRSLRLGWASNAVLPSSVPERLRGAVGRGGRKMLYTYGRISYANRGQPVPGLITGAALGPRYQLYYLFPLTQEQQTLDLVQRSLVVVGAALVLLLAAIASLVTRWVVLPVRMAAHAAERLAGGRLDERMPVRGEDDLARLASSFNEMAANLQEKIRELEELSQVQRQFVSDVSHELRTPLTTIRIAADLLHESRESFEPAVARSAELLQTQLERFEALLADLLEISRYDAGAATLDAESADIRDIVLRAVGDTEHLAERRGTKVVLRLPGEPCLAEVDSRRVERILRNLLVNAIEHGEGRDVVVTAAADRDAVAVTVRDHGVGLRPGEEHLVFDRFWRADPARARTTGGTGLGLSIAREDALLHGGWLQAWGEPGCGCQFRLSLPRVAGQELQGSPLPLVPPEVERARNRYVPVPDPPALPTPPRTSSTPGVSAGG